MRPPTLVPCPVGRTFNVDHTEDGPHPICPTMLQPRGQHPNPTLRLVAGVQSHLEIVHGMAAHDADVEAHAWVTVHRAKG